uniref:Lipid-binding serum glycoprotein N-terminal domain-containing protein n=1 Tax=Anopheles farauti TaxID=69004 RepID=A0A182QCQ0_9DIPT
MATFTILLHYTFWLACFFMIPNVHGAVEVIGARPYLESVAKRVVEILETRYISGNSLPIADYVAPIELTEKGISINGNVSFHSAFIAKIASIEFDSQKYSNIFLDSEVTMQGGLKWNGIGVVLDFEANLEEHQGTGTLYVTYNQFDFPLKVTKYFNSTEPTGSLQFMSIDNANKILTVGHPNNKYVQMISRAIMTNFNFRDYMIASFRNWNFQNLLKAVIDEIPFPEDVEHTVCNQTEYESYRDCIEETKALRQKRYATPCPPVIVAPVIHTVKPFEMLVPVNPLMPTTNSPMLKNLDRTIIVRPESHQVDDEDVDDYENNFRVPLNVTTVIRLTNIVNNTNYIHMPTINNTNVNNIQVYANLTDDARDEPVRGKTERCCTAVRPKTCHSSTLGIRCRHQKFQSCGAQCTSDIIHVHKRKRCHRATSQCEEKIAYVPQPKNQTCVYIDDWPFVVCGKVANMSVICAGCYDHYGTGYEAYNGHSRMYDQCRGCYDDAFDVGPKYRRGPVLRPFYYHQAPCYISGNCEDIYRNCGYGCYGHDRIDPAWGDDQLDTYDPSSMHVSVEESDDWGVPTAKCAIVSDGKVIAIKNCTDIDNAYVAAPATHPYYKPIQVKPKNKKVDPSPAVDDEEDPEMYGSGNDALKNEVSFVEEYVDDDDFTL